MNVDVNVGVNKITADKISGVVGELGTIVYYLIHIMHVTFYVPSIIITL